MSLALIRDAFDSRLGEWADAQSITVAWPNTAFTPPAGVYLRAFLLPADTDSRDLGGRHREYRGLYQVSVCLPANTGPEGGDSIVSALDALYPTTSPLTSGGLQIWLTRPMSAGPAIQEPNRFVIPCSLGYVANAYS